MVNKEESVKFSFVDFRGKVNDVVRPKKFQFLEKWQNRNFDYEIVKIG